MKTQQEQFAIQRECGLYKLQNPLEEYIGQKRGAEQVRESLHLAVAQTAICLATENGAVPDDLKGRIEVAGDYFSLDDVLSEKEARFLPAAKTIVGLTFAAARSAATFDRKYNG